MASLTTRITDLATRIGVEIKAVRAAAVAKPVTLGSNPGVTLGAGATQYGLLNSGTATLNATEAARSFLSAADGNATRITVNISSAQSSLGTIVVTLRKNETDTDLVLTIPAGSAAGTYSAIGTVSFTVGDMLALRFKNNASTTSATLRAFALAVVGA